MSQFAPEALFIGIKEGLKVSLTLFVVVSWFRSAGLEELRKPVIAGILTVCASSLALLTLSFGIEVRELVVKLIGYTFGLFYIFSLGALLHTSGTDMLGPLGRISGKSVLLPPLVFLLTLLYYVPDMAGSSLYLADLFFMSGRETVLFLIAGAGLAGALTCCLFLLPLLGKRLPLAVMFGLPQVFLFLALVKLTASGVRGFAELSLIPAVQSGLMTLVHDIIHQTFVMLMVPDHPILSTTAWDFIGIFFGNTLSLWLSLIVLVLPLLVFLKKHFSEEVPVPPTLGKGPSRRLYIKAFQDSRLLKSIPLFLFLAFILTAWFTEKGEGLSALYKPEPKPVVAVNGVVTIPLNTPGEDLRDGMLHKFSLVENGQVRRLLVMKKPDGTLAVCLDACEICQPAGYGQGKEHVVCIYCNTPIPFDTVGQPGGCNPIPVAGLVTEKEIKVDLSEIDRKWQTVNSAQNRENRPE